MANDFVSLFIDLTKKYESPTSFWRWAAYAGVGAILRNNVWHRWGTSKIYPNVYILFLEDSAKSRKDAPIKLVEKLLKEIAQTKVLSGRASYQGVVDHLSNDIGVKAKGITLRGGSCLLIAPEFSAFFVKDPDLIGLLTEGYSYEEEYDYTLRGNQVKVKDRCLSLLAASNEQLLRNVYDKNATEGGLLRRTFLVKKDETRPGNSLMEDDDSMSDPEYKELITQLNRIKVLKGEITKTDDAKQYYKEWYLELYNKYGDIQDRTGFYYGIHALVFKLAIIIAASNYTLCISRDIMKEAIDQVSNLKNNYNQYVMGVGANPAANISTVIIKTIWEHSLQNGGKLLSRREILFKFWNEISSEDLDKALSTLQQANVIDMVPNGVEPSYVLTQRAKEIFLKNAQAKSQKVN